jgi:hypothetical protein
MCSSTSTTSRTVGSSSAGRSTSIIEIGWNRKETAATFVTSASGSMQRVTASIIFAAAVCETRPRTILTSPSTRR